MPLIHVPYKAQLTSHIPYTPYLETTHFQYLRPREQWSRDCSSACGGKFRPTILLPPAQLNQPDLRGVTCLLRSVKGKVYNYENATNFVCQAAVLPGDNVDCLYSGRKHTRQRRAWRGLYDVRY